jgi:urea transporter
MSFVKGFLAVVGIALVMSNLQLLLTILVLSLLTSPFIGIIWCLLFPKED